MGPFSYCVVILYDFKTFQKMLYFSFPPLKIAKILLVHSYPKKKYHPTLTFCDHFSGVSDDDAAFVDAILGRGGPNASKLPPRPPPVSSSKSPRPFTPNQELHHRYLKVI